MSTKEWVVIYTITNPLHDYFDFEDKKQKPELHSKLPRTHYQKLYKINEI